VQVFIIIHTVIFWNNVHKVIDSANDTCTDRQVTTVHMDKIQGISESLQHCIRLQNSVYERFRARKFPYKEVTEL